MKPTLLLSLCLLSTAPSWAASVTVFLDNGSTAPNSTNTASPFTNNDRESVWDISSTAQSGLASIGAAVMQVRMVTFNVNGDSRGATTAGGNGLGISTGTNNDWIDSGEAALFQFRLFSDAGKTTELTNLSYTLSSIIIRMTESSNRVIIPHVGSGALTFDNGGDPLTTIPSPLDNNSNIYLNGSLLSRANDSTNASTVGANLVPSSFPGGATPTFYTVASTGVSFDESDSIWFRRVNLAGAADAAYQLGAITFDVIPEPGSMGLFGVAILGLAIRRQRNHSL